MHNDGMHFRQPWVMGMQQEVERLKERFHEQEKLLRECEALKGQVKMMLMRVAELEKRNLPTSFPPSSPSAVPTISTSKPL
ncbi:hypothetical protein HID58_095454 [Brassica napus]|uniref:Uncharacterized protein n=1 Tax=Brassica napus TaxID=3708 RepID=A0ABQ7X414_BRANA|nr:hypothetical protein HID58_095454 [Brassica napus]